jgi:DNA-binding NarL/FixJ family response regulator
VAIVDLILGQETGLELLKRLGARLQALPVLILTMLPENLNAATALELGARGYIMKSESPDKILEALRQVLKGNVYLENSHE